MNLRQYLRQDFALTLRPLLVKDKCDICGDTKNTHLHHIDRFHNLLVETLLELNVNELNDIEEYPKEVLLNIRDKMISKQLRIDYMTLCEQCHKKLHGKELKSEVYKENVYNPYGNYFFLNVERLKNIPYQFVFRFLYLCTYMNYENKLVFGKQKGKGKYITKRDLQEVLQLSEREVSRTKKVLIDSDLIKVDLDNNLFIDKIIAYKGYNPNYSNYKRFFVDFTQQLYKNNAVALHKTLCKVLDLINKIDVYNHIVNEDNKQLSKTQLYLLLGYKGHKPERLKIYFDNNILIEKDGAFFINPAFTFSQPLSTNLKKIEQYLK